MERLKPLCSSPLRGRAMTSRGCHVLSTQAGLTAQSPALDMDCGEGRVICSGPVQSLDDLLLLWMGTAPATLWLKGLWEPSRPQRGSGLFHWYPPARVAASVWIPGLDSGHALAHCAVFRHTDC